MHDLETVATAFVDLAMKYPRWAEVVTLPPEDIRLLYVVLTTAGHDVAEVVPGPLYVHGRDQDGSATDERFCINTWCKFTALDSDGQPDYRATSWLNALMHRAAVGQRFSQESRDQRIEAILAEIKRSIPFAPIRLTTEGDELVEYPPSCPTSALVNDQRDESPFGSTVGLHRYCRGTFTRRRATARHDALCCTGCGLRVLFPLDTKTYGQLRHYLANLV